MKRRLSVTTLVVMTTAAVFTLRMSSSLRTWMDDFMTFTLSRNENKTDKVQMVVGFFVLIPAAGETHLSCRQSFRKLI